MKIDWEYHLTTFALGLITALCIAVVGGIVWGAFAGPAICGVIVGVVVGLYLLGYVHIKISEAIDEWKRKSHGKTDVKVPYKSRMTNPTLALLDELESKYNMTTLTFMQLVEIKDQPVDPKDYIVFQQNWDNILGGVNALDMVTWIGLINSLSEVISIKELEAK